LNPWRESREDQQPDRSRGLQYLADAPNDELLGSERVTGALLERLTHHVHILEMKGDSFRLKNSRKKKDPGPQ